MYPLSRVIRVIVLLVSAAVLISAVGGAGLALARPALANGERVAWGMFGFEAVIGVTAVLGVLIGVGRFASGTGLALACVGGTVLVASVLGWVASGKHLGSVSLMPLLLARVTASLTIGLAAAMSVLCRRSGSWRIAISGALLVLPVVIGAAGLVYPATRQRILSAAGAGPAIQFVAAVGGFLVATALLSAGVHLIILAFERGRTEDATSRSA